MFRAKQPLRMSRKGIVRMNDAQIQNLETLKNLDEKMEKSTVEQIPLEFKCQFSVKIRALREEVLHNTDQKNLQSQIADLSKLLNDIYDGKYSQFINCENIDSLRVMAKELEATPDFFVTKRKF